MSFKETMAPIGNLESQGPWNGIRTAGIRKLITSARSNRESTGGLYHEIAGFSFTAFSACLTLGASKRMFPLSSIAELHEFLLQKDN